MIPTARAPYAVEDAVRLAPEGVGDGAAVDALIDKAFGPGRYAKTAERLRESARLRRDLSVCAWSGTDMIGVVRLWDIQVGGSNGLFLGPIAVRPASRGHGVGVALASRACEAAEAADEAWVLLVGARSFFEPLGFEPTPRGRIVLPGPVDPARLLWRPFRIAMVEGFGGVAEARGEAIVRTPKRPAKLPSPMRG